MFDTAAPLLMSWSICAVSPSSAPDTFSTNSLASVGLMAESTGPSEFKNASMLPSVTSWLSGMVAPGGRTGPDGPGNSSISFWPMTLCQRMPTSVERRNVTELLTLMTISACPCWTPMLETCPTGTPAMLTSSPVARAGDVAQLGVEGVAAAEQRDVPDFDRQPDQQDQAHEREDGELEGRLREAVEQPHDAPPSNWLMMPPMVVGLDVSGWPIMP